MKIYYAHCMTLYGTPQEARDIKTLKALGFRVVNPSDKKFDKLFKSLPSSDARMAFCERWSNECDAVAFRSLPDGTIPSGVAKEIAWFQLRHKPIIELPSLALRKTLSTEDTRRYLEESGSR